MTALGVKNISRKTLGLFPDAQVEGQRSSAVEVSLRRIIADQRRTLSTSPPVFWREYLDPWSLLNFLVHYLIRNDATIRWVRTKSTGAVYFDPSALKRCSRRMRVSLARHPQNDMYLAWLQETIIAANTALISLQGNGLFIHFELLGPSLSDWHSSPKEKSGGSAQLK